MLCTSELNFNWFLLVTMKSTSDSTHWDCSDNIFNILKELSARICGSSTYNISDNPLLQPENIITVWGISPKYSFLYHDGVKIGIVDCLQGFL